MHKDTFTGLCLVYFIKFDKSSAKTARAGKLHPESVLIIFQRHINLYKPTATGYQNF